jgi:hypothetical protein
MYVSSGCPHVNTPYLTYLTWWNNKITILRVFTSLEYDRFLLVGQWDIGILIGNRASGNG